MLYAVINPKANSLEQKLIGYHEKKKVATQYYYSLKTLDDGYKYKLVQCKKKELKRIPDYQDHYLIRFGRNYIPSIYYEIAKENIYTVLFEYTHTMEILQRIFELEKLTPNDKRILEEAIFIVNDQYEKEKDCVIDPNIIARMREMYEEWQRKTIYAQPLNDDEWVDFFSVDEG